MGCISSKEHRFRAYTADVDAPTEFNEIDKVTEYIARSPPTQAIKPEQPALGDLVNIPRPKLDPKDFQFVNCADELKIRNPGSIVGQSFMIDKCENCDIYILDYCGQVTVDDCKGCRLYIGPTDGSVFVRNCTGCNLAVLCRQLRTRDCTNCNFSLYCRTKPIIESSSNMGFSCLDLSYPCLQDHMRHAKLNIFHNFWYDIFDFTPKDGNWRLLPRGTTATSLLEPMPTEVSEVITAGETPAESPLLLTLGSSLPKSVTSDLSYLFVVFDGSKHNQALQMARTAAEMGWLLRTNEVRLSSTAATALASEAGWSKSKAKALRNGNVVCVGMELSVPADESQAVKAQASKLGGLISEIEVAGKTLRTAGLDG